MYDLFAMHVSLQGVDNPTYGSALLPSQYVASIDEEEDEPQYEIMNPVPVGARTEQYASLAAPSMDNPLYANRNAEGRLRNNSIRRPNDPMPSTSAAQSPFYVNHGATNRPIEGFEENPYEEIDGL